MSTQLIVMTTKRCKECGKETNMDTLTRFNRPNGSFLKYLCPTCVAAIKQPDMKREGKYRKPSERSGAGYRKNRALDYLSKRFSDV